jgi:large subunit ribosomal protein L10
MSKFVKNLVAEHYRRRLDGVSDMLLVNVIGMSANGVSSLRRRLREQNIQLMVVKNSQAARATEGTVLAPAFEGATGTLAIVWGAEDIVSLAKQITKLAGDPAFPKLETRGGVMEGGPLTAEGVAAISKWKSRTEQLSVLVAQILAPGSKLSSQLLGPGSKLASQIKKKGEGEEEGAAPTAEAPNEEAPNEEAPNEEAPNEEAPNAEAPVAAAPSAEST